MLRVSLYNVILFYNLTAYNICVYPIFRLFEDIIILINRKLMTNIQRDFMVNVAHSFGDLKYTFAYSNIYSTVGPPVFAGIINYCQMSEQIAFIITPC